MVSNVLYTTNLKGESALAAILPSHMVVSYYTFGFFFVAKPANLRGVLSFLSGLSSHTYLGYCTVNTRQQKVAQIAPNLKIQ